MRSSKETKILNTICILLVLLAGVVRLLLWGSGKFGYNGLILALFTVSIFIWVCQLKRRLLQPHVRRNLMGAAAMMILWMAIRTMKYEFLIQKEHFSSRYAWYLYYVPLIFIPLLLFLSVLYIGKPHDRAISHWWNIFYLPAGILVAGVLTNDFHQLAFRFPGDFTTWSDDNYIHGPVYYGVLVWTAVLFVAVMAVVFVRCAVHGNQKKIWIPMIPFFVGIVYTLLYILKIDNVLTKMLTVPEISCFLFAAFMEGLIIAHLFPSNDSYSDFWNASSIGAGIMDEEGVIHYKSQHSISVSEEQIRAAEEQAVFLENGRVALRSHRIQGGFCYWVKDVSEINHLNKMLADLGNVLAEENAMLEAENEMKEERTRIQQQNALYDDIAKKVSPQLAKISRLLNMPSQNETEFIENMKYACILNAYVKRCSNLLLLFHQNNRIESDELRLAISETLDYARLYGIKAHGAYQGEARLSGDSILLTYELFEAVLESAIPGANALLVNMDIQEDMLSLQIEINAPGEILSENILDEKISALGGMLNIELEQQTEYISFMLPTGGESL